MKVINFYAELDDEEFLDENGNINENCKRNLDMYTVNCRKVSADVYIDDKSYQEMKGVEKLWRDWYN